MTKRRKELGQYGERLALKQYERGGYTLLVQNYRCRLGEIDLILCKDTTIIFVEVRTKTTLAYGAPEETITPRKKRKIRIVSQIFLQQHTHFLNYNFQYDVVSIFLQLNQKKAWINRITDAF